MEVRQLAAFVAVAHARSLRRAAARLDCSQSTLSKRLADLERTLDARLVVRGPGVPETRLTDAGRLFLGHAEVVLDRLEAARGDLSARKRRDLRVGVFRGTPLRLLPSILERLGDLQVTPCEEANDLDLLSDLRFSRLDLTFARLPLPAGPFAYIRLFEEPWTGLSVSDDPHAAATLSLETTVLAWHRYRRLSGAAERFRQVAREAFAAPQPGDLGS